MQNNKRNKLCKFIAEKGYFFALAACVIALGVSGVLLVRSMREESVSPVLRVQEDDPATASSDMSPETPETPDDAPTPADPPEEATETLSPDEAVAQAAAAIVVRPLTGATVLPYAMEELTYHPTTQDWRTHDGLDIAAAVGTPVLAACAGTVEEVRTDDRLGALVVLLHADGVRTIYANLTGSPAVQQGQKVAAGDILGAVGETATLEIGEEPHLHFAVTKNGQPIDPADYLPD